jgi:hypothetical protein
MAKKKFDILLTEILILLKKREDKINGFICKYTHTSYDNCSLPDDDFFTDHFLRSRNIIICAKESHCGQLKVILLQTDSSSNGMMNHVQRCS